MDIGNHTADGPAAKILTSAITRKQDAMASRLKDRGLTTYWSPILNPIFLSVLSSSV
jgi:hypothetical protein